MFFSFFQISVIATLFGLGLFWLGLSGLSFLAVFLYSDRINVVPLHRPPITSVLSAGKAIFAFLS